MVTDTKSRRVDVFSTIVEAPFYSPVSIVDVGTGLVMTPEGHVVNRPIRDMVFDFDDSPLDGTPVVSGTMFKAESGWKLSTETIMCLRDRFRQIEPEWVSDVSVQESLVVVMDESPTAISRVYDSMLRR